MKYYLIQHHAMWLHGTIYQYKISIWCFIMLGNATTAATTSTQIIKGSSIPTALPQATRLNRLTRIVRVAALMPRRSFMVLWWVSFHMAMWIVLCVYIYVCMYVCMYVCIHMHTLAFHVWYLIYDIWCNYVSLSLSFSLFLSLSLSRSLRVCIYIYI